MRESDLPKVSVVVPYFGTASIGELVQAIRDQDYPTELTELVLVDNNPEPVLEDGIAGALVLRETRPGSYAARNTGARAARGTVLAFTDADCLPRPEWLSSGVDALREAHEEVLVSGKVQVLTSAKPTVAEEFDRMFGFPQERHVSAGWAVTANLITSKSTWERVGGFDAALMSGGDRDFGLRAGALGIAVVFAPSAIVDHPARASARAILRKAARLSGSTAGVVRRQDGGRLWVHVIRYLVPPIRTWTRLRQESGLSITTRVGVVGLLYLTHLLGACEYVRVGYLGGKPRRD